MRAWDEVVDKKPFPIYTNHYDFHTLIFDLDEFKPYDISVSYDSIKSYEYDSHNFNIANHCGS